MDRKDFFKSVCGACGCAGIMMFTPANLLADDNTLKETKEDDWRIGFMQKRMAKFIEDMYSKLDNKTITTILENMGRFCSQGNSENADKFKGDVNFSLPQKIVRVLSVRGRSGSTIRIYHGS